MEAWTRVNESGFFRTKPSSGEQILSAGSVNDVLHIDEVDTNSTAVTLVACPTSGVWQVFDNGDNPSTTPTTVMHTPSVSLSMTWDNPRMSCLLQGPRDRLQIFAAGETLWVTDITQTEPLKHWQKIQIEDLHGNPFRTGIIQGMSLTDNEDIVLACDHGVLWAKIPSTTFPARYVFTQATVQSVSPMYFSSATRGTLNNTIAIAAWGGKPINSRGGIFIGSFVSGNLKLVEPTILVNDDNPPEWGLMKQAAVASCPTARDVMFVVATGFDDRMYCVLRSMDSGSTWVKVTKPTTTKSLPEDGRLRIAAAALGDGTGGKRYTVIIGWHTEYFILDHGSLWNDPFQTWTKIDTLQDISQMPHFKIRNIRLVTKDNIPATQTLYLCTEEGLAVVPQLDNKPQLGFNRLLPNLQTLGVDLNNAKLGLGLIAASFQNGGNAYCNIYPDASLWASFRKGNGGSVTFLSNGRLLDHDTDVEPSPSQAGVQERKLGLLSKVNEWTQKLGVIPLEGSPSTGLVLKPEHYPAQRNGFSKQIWPIERVRSPSWKDGGGKLLVAVAGRGQELFGLMLGDVETDLRWVLLGSVFPGPFLLGEVILSVASADGSSIAVGTNNGSIIGMVPPSSPATPTWTAENIWNIDHPGASTVQITKITVHFNGRVFATASGGRILQLSGTTWVDIPSPAQLFPLPDGTVEEYTGIDAIQRILSLCVCTETRVFVMNNRNTWTDISLGLPKAPSCTGIRSIAESGGMEYIYVATFGWSLWRLRLGVFSVPDVPGLSLTASRGGGTSEWHITIVRITGDDDGSRGPIPLEKRILSASAPVREIPFDLHHTSTGPLNTDPHNLFINLTVRYELEASTSTVEGYWHARQADGVTGLVANQESVPFSLAVGDNTPFAILLDDGNDDSTSLVFDVGLR